MSAILMGAVMNCGPAKGSRRYALVAIADNADDYGFACPSLQTIAAKVCCDVRTAIRHVHALEREGWVRVVRDVFEGKGNVYFVNVAKLGVTVNEASRKSRLHVQIAKQLKARDEEKSHDKLSRKKPGAPETSRDNPQGGHVTKMTPSRDKNAVAISKNHKEPSRNQYSPLPPSRGVNETSGGALPELTRDEMRKVAEDGLADPRTGECRAAFEGVLKLVHHALFQTSISLGSKLPKHLADGAKEWEACFASARVIGYDAVGGRLLGLVVSSENPRATEAGLKKYHLRIGKGMQQYFGAIVPVRCVGSGP
jgi:hypothetical protein